MGALANTDGSVGMTREEILTLKDAVLDAATFAKLTPVEVQSLMDRIDAGDVLGVLKEVQAGFDRNRPVIRPVIAPGTPANPARNSRGTDIAGHVGRRFGPNHNALIVGRHGSDELVVFDNHMQNSRQVHSTEDTSRMAGAAHGGGGAAPMVNINVTAGLGTDGNAVARAIEPVVMRAFNNYLRNNGPASLQRLEMG
jgi:hypothetical protein